MATIRVKRFDGGAADDKYGASVGQFSITKHFDTLTYPNRLYPLRGMGADTTGTGIGNLIVGSDNNFYGLGWSAADHTIGVIWKRGASSWSEFTSNTANTLNYDLLAEYHDSSGNRVLVHANANNKLGIIKMDDSGASTHDLTFTNIAQGYVHPEDDILYIPYDNKIAANNNGTWTDEALVLPANYRITSLTRYGSYLAIAACPSVSGVDYGGGAGITSKVFLWDRNTSNTTVSEVINWGAGNLKVLDNLDEVLVGISDQGGSNSNILDRDSVVIRAYSGGPPIILSELSTDKQTSTSPDASVSPRVKFVFRDRMYFSVDLSGGSTSPSYHGLWSIGKSKLSGRYAATLERVATVDNSETTVIAAAITGDKCVMVYDAEGTLSVSNSTSGTGAQYTATSVYESLVNPEMVRQNAEDFDKRKQVAAFGAYFVPLLSGAQVVAQYRVDGGAWTTLFTKTSTSPDANLTACEVKTDADGDPFTAGTHYEFRLQSTGGAQIVGYAYKYTVLDTDL